MTRSTPDDELFKRRVADEFTRARDRAISKGWSMEKFVKSLGITRAAFNKHVNRKAIPSLRVLEKARKYWGIQLRYGELGDAYVRTKKKDPRQMEFQFSIADVSKEQIEVRRFSPNGETAVELVIKIDFSRTA